MGMEKDLGPVHGRRELQGVVKSIPHHVHQGGRSVKPGPGLEQLWEAASVV